MCPVGSHSVGTCNGTQCNGILVGAFVTHNAHAAHFAQQDSACLPYLVVEANLDFAVLHVGRNTGCEHTACLLSTEFHLIVTQAAYVDVVGILQHAQLLASDGTQDAHSQAGTGEGMACDEMLGHTQLASHAAHLVLEEPLEGLAQRQVHLLGQTTHIVVALDYLACYVERLDAVRVDGALSEPLGILNLLSLGIEHLDEVAANDLALLLGLGYALEVAQELVAGVDAYHIEAKALIVLHNIGKLILAQHAVVNEDTSELVAYSTVEQHGTHRTVDTAREAQYHAVRTYLLTQLLDCSLDVVGSRPVLLATAHINYKVLEQLCALNAVEHLGVELNAKERLAVKRGDVVCGILHLWSASHYMGTCGDCGDGVTMAHPHLTVVVKALEQGARLVDSGEVLATILAATSGLNIAAIGVSDVLSAIADA